MAVIKVHKTKGYTVMSNHHLREKEMSLKAKGLLSIMFSLPEDWDYSIAGLVTLSKDGKDSVMKALKELEEFGYLVRTKITNELGQFKGYQYDIYEEPNSAKPNKEKPYAEKPNTDNPPQIITNKQNTKEPTTEEVNDKLDKNDKNDKKEGEFKNSTIQINNKIETHNSLIKMAYLKPTALTKMVIKQGYISQDDPFIPEYNEFLMNLTEQYEFTQVRDCIGYFFSQIKGRREEIEDRLSYFEQAMINNLLSVNTDWSQIYSLAGGK